jgi:hypothetical protein
MMKYIIAFLLLIATPCQAGWNVWLDDSLKKYRQGGEAHAPLAVERLVCIAKKHPQTFHTAQVGFL